MTPEDVFELVQASDPRVSPDGTTCAFVVTTIDKDDNAYKSAIWLVPIDGLLALADAPQSDPDHGV